MRISRSTGYAILAVGYIAQNQKQGIILSQSVSKKYNIPLEYLLKILQQLVRANVLRSKRGPRGGFNLAQPAKKITMLQIIEAVEGPMISQLNLMEQARGEKFAARAEKNYQKAIAQAKSVFQKVKLTDLLEG
ncbi:MAG: Rrf2 family transcriptional regulator [Planctomycetota bacterium]|nr:MAG: Rrf2 family transcriptional regulator [Planctomycetota bacterium]